MHQELELNNQSSCHTGVEVIRVESLPDLQGVSFEHKIAYPQPDNLLDSLQARDELGLESSKQMHHLACSR
jgi:hypothetical protein